MASAQIGKRVAQVDIKCNADVFLDLFRYKPKNLSSIAPNHVKSCELIDGEWGVVGSTVAWNYLIDGKPQASNQLLEAADEKNKSITYTAFGGDLMQAYKSVKAIIRVEPKDHQNSLVTWTVEYEKVSEDIPDPDSLLDLAYKITKDVEARQV